MTNQQWQAAFGTDVNMTKAIKDIATPFVGEYETDGKSYQEWHDEFMMICEQYAASENAINQSYRAKFKDTAKLFLKAFLNLNQYATHQETHEHMSERFAFQTEHAHDNLLLIKAEKLELEESTNTQRNTKQVY